MIVFNFSSTRVFFIKNSVQLTLPEWTTKFYRTVSTKVDALKIWHQCRILQQTDAGVINHSVTLPYLCKDETNKWKLGKVQEGKSSLSL